MPRLRWKRLSEAKKAYNNFFRWKYFKQEESLRVQRHFDSKILYIERLLHTLHKNVNFFEKSWLLEQTIFKLLPVL